MLKSKNRRKMSANISMLGVVNAQTHSTNPVCNLKCEVRTGENIHSRETADRENLK